MGTSSLRFIISNCVSYIFVAWTGDEPDDPDYFGETLTPPVVPQDDKDWIKRGGCLEP